MVEKFIKDKPCHIAESDIDTISDDNYPDLLHVKGNKTTFL